MNNPFIPKDNYISRIADKLAKEENKKKYNEFTEIFYKSIKESTNRNIPVSLTNMLKVEYKAVTKMIKLK